MAKGRTWGWYLERFGPLIALVLLILGTVVVEHFRVEDPSSRAFLTAHNFATILGQWSYVGVVALGMTFVIILGGIDLSVGSMVALAAGASIYVMNKLVADAGWGAGSAIAAAFAVCLLGGPLLGLVNGVTVGFGRIAPFVATLGTLAIFRSLVMARADGSEIRSIVPGFQDIGGWTWDFKGWGGNGNDLTLRLGAVVFVALAIVAHIVLKRTVFGRQVYAIGDNAKAARYAGVKVSLVTTAVYTISGFACGVAALLNASRLNSVSSSSLGLFYELDAIAAVVIGGTRLQGGSGRVFGTVVGVLILGVVSNMLNLLEVSNFYHGLVKGLIILAAVMVQPRKDTI